MTSLSGKRLVARPVVALLIAAMIGVPGQSAASASEPDDGDDAIRSPSRHVVVVNEPFASGEALVSGTIRASILRLALSESRRLERSDQSAAVNPSDRCPASVTEKLAWLYAVVGGSLLLAYGPREREGGVWTMDGKSETAAGAVAIALSFALLHDIRKKGR